MGVHGVDWNLVALNVEDEQVLGFAAADAHLDMGAFGALEALHDALVANTHTGHHFPIDFDDAVSRHDAQLFTRPTGDGGDDHDGVLHDVEAHADAFELAVEWLIGLLQVFRRDVDGVRVELLEHAADGGFDESIEVHAVHIHAVHVVEERVEFLSLLLHGLLGEQNSGQDDEGAKEQGMETPRHVRKIGAGCPGMARVWPVNSQKMKPPHRRILGARTCSA